jgi:hypothetical protein
LSAEGRAWRAWIGCGTYALVRREMANDRDNFDPYRTLNEYSGHVNGIRWARSGLPFYDLMSGGLVWADETRRNLRRTPTEVIWALRALWAYRTSLMLNEPREELVEFWEYGLAHFPRWVGFRPERREPTSKLLEIYRRGDVSLRKCLRDLEREEAGA